MQLPIVLADGLDRPKLDIKDLKREGVIGRDNPSLFIPDQVCGTILVEPRPNGVAVSYRAICKATIYRTLDVDVDLTITQRGKAERLAFLCPKCERPTRFLYFDNMGCALCTRIKHRVDAALLNVVTMDRTTAQKAETTRLAALTPDELQAEVQARADAQAWIDRQETPTK